MSGQAIPVGVYYYLEDDCIVIVSVFDQRQDPRNWKEWMGDQGLTD